MNKGNSPDKKITSRSKRSALRAKKYREEQKKEKIFTDLSLNDLSYDDVEKIVTLQSYSFSEQEMQLKHDIMCLIQIVIKYDETDEEFVTGMHCPCCDVTVKKWSTDLGRLEIVLPLDRMTENLAKYLAKRGWPIHRIDKHGTWRWLNGDADDQVFWRIIVP